MSGNGNDYSSLRNSYHSAYDLVKKHNAWCINSYSSRNERMSLCRPFKCDQQTFTITSLLWFIELMPIATSSLIVCTYTQLHSCTVNIHYLNPMVVRTCPQFFSPITCLLIFNLHPSEQSKQGAFLICSFIQVSPSVELVN